MRRRKIEKLQLPMIQDESKKEEEKEKMEDKYTRD